MVKTEKYNSTNKYQRDLLYLDNLCANSFPDIENKFPTKERARIIDSLLTVLDSTVITDNIFNGYIRFYLSHFKNEHTSISGLQSRMMFPYLLYPVDKSWYIWDINKEYDSLHIGKKIIRLAGKSMVDIENNLFNYVFAENPINQRHSITPFLNRSDLLQQFGFIKQTDSIQLVLENGDEITVRSVTKNDDLKFTLGVERDKQHEVTKFKNYNYNISLYPKENYAYFQYNRCNDKIDSYEHMRDYLKGWIIPFAKIYMNHHIKKKNTSKLHGYADPERPIFKDYLQLMFDSINDNNIQNLIIDLRNNPGGSFQLCLQLLYYLTDRSDLIDFSEMYYTSDYNKQIDKEDYKEFEKKYKLENGFSPQNNKLYPNGFSNCDSFIFEKIEDHASPYYIDKSRAVFKGKVYVLADFGTSSAAALFATLLQDNNIATVIGTSVGNNPIGATNFRPFRLPETKMRGSVATGYLVRPKVEKGNVQFPDYWIENSVTDMINGEDRIFEKALELINEKNNDSR